MSGIQVSGMIYFISAMVIGFGAFIYSIYKSVNLVKDKRQTIDYKRDYLMKIIPAICVFAVLFTLGLLSIYIWNSYNATPLNYVEAIFGGLFFALALAIGTDSFIIHYYKKGLPAKLDKILYYSLMISIPMVVLFFFIGASAFSDMCGEHFLLPYGISFSEGFVRPDSPYKANIAFYALCILSGAVFVYFLCDHLLYKEYGKHGTIDATFLVAFPAGILGARIAYVIGNWKLDGFDARVARGEWWSIFAIWEGGLTILGGAIAGIVVGVLVYIKTNKGRSIFKAVDIIVPTILLAQAIGRWGNFFNCEVHGGLVPEQYWYWLPKFIFNNAHYSSASGAGWAPEGYLYAPLFFIEFLVNLFGYFVLAHLFGIRLKKICAPGDLAFGYVIWYGYTRVFMEPLRYSAYNMGTDGYWSWLWSLIFVAVGTLLIAVNHIVRYVIKYKKGEKGSYSKKSNIITGSSLLAISIAFIVIGSVMMSVNQGGLEIALNGHNVGIIFLVSGLALFTLFVATLIELILKIKGNNNQLGEANA